MDSCDKVANTGMTHLKEVFQKLTSLRSVSLCFKRFTDHILEDLLIRCFQMSNAGLSYLKEGFPSLTSLTHLSLDFTS